MRITEKWLLARSASPADIALFSARFPDGAEHEEVLNAFIGTPENGSVWHDRLVFSMVMEIAETDPRAAADYAAKIPIKRWRGWAQYRIAIIWARTDLHAAAEYAAKIQNDFWRGWALSAIERIGGGA